MKLSQIKQIKSFCVSLHSMPEWTEAVSNIQAGNKDFTVREG